MKAIFVMVFMLFAAFVQAQDVITFSTGENINAKVVEVGVSEIRYYKSGNLQGPLYTAMKIDVYQISYANGARDQFGGAYTQGYGQPYNPVIVTQPIPQTVIIDNPVRRVRSYGYPVNRYPVISPHIDLGRRGKSSHHSRSRTHH